MRAWDHLPLPISRESYFIDPGESPDISTKTNKQTNFLNDSNMQSKEQLSSGGRRKWDNMRE